MTYVQHTWINGDTSRPINATRLGEMEQGIFDAHALVATETTARAADTAAARAEAVAAIAAAVSAVASSTAYVIASSTAPAEWRSIANSTVTAGADCAAAITAAFASTRKQILVAGALSLLTPVTVTPGGDNVTFNCVDGGYIQCGPQVGATPDAPPTMLTITGTRTTIATTPTLPIAAGAMSATFSTIGTIVGGDYVLLHSATLFGPNRSNEYTGEIIRVDSTVGGVTLRFGRPVRYTYPVGATFTLARYVMPRNFRTNLDIRGDETSMVRQTPCLLRYMRDVVLSGTSVSQGLAATAGIRTEEISRLHFDHCWAERVLDAHGSSASYTGTTSATTGAVSAGGTSVTIGAVTGPGFPILQSGFAWLGNPGAVNPELLIAFTAVIGGEPVRVINVVGSTWTLAAPGFTAAHASGVAIALNASHTGYGYHIVGCANVTGTISGRTGRHLFDVKSVATRPCSFKVNITSPYAVDFAGPPFSTHGSVDQVGWTDAVSEGSGGHEVFRGVNHHSIRSRCVHPRRWTRGIYDKHQAYSAGSLWGEGVDDGGLSGDNAVIHDFYMDAAGCNYEINGIEIRDSAVGIEITGRQVLAPTNNGVWIAGPAVSGRIDVAVNGTNQLTVLATPERRQAAVQIYTETGGTAGLSIRSLDLTIEDRGCVGPFLYIEGNATDVSTLNSEVDVRGRKVALGAGQTSATAQIVRGTGYHLAMTADVRLPGTLYASAVSTLGTATRPVEWSRNSRFSDGRAPLWDGSGSDRLGLVGPKRVGSLAWTGDPTLFSGATALVTGRLETAELWVPAGTITDVRYLVSVAGAGITAGQSFVSLFAPGAGGALLAQTADQAANLASTAGTVVTAALTAPYVSTGGYVRVAIHSVFATTAPQLLRGASNQAANAGTAAPYRFSHSGATVYTTAPPATLPTMTAQNNSWWFELVGTQT